MVTVNAGVPTRVLLDYLASYRCHYYCAQSTHDFHTRALEAALNQALQ